MTEQDVLKFVRTHIPSVWTLEILILLCDSRGSSWSTETLVRESRSSAIAVTAAVKFLEQMGFVVEEAPGVYRYQPASPEIEALAADVRTLYASKPASVVNAIFGGSNEKLRIFAEAFKLKE